MGPPDKTFWICECPDNSPALSTAFNTFNFTNTMGVDQIGALRADHSAASALALHCTPTRRTLILYLLRNKMKTSLPAESQINEWKNLIKSWCQLVDPLV